MYLIVVNPFHSTPISRGYEYLTGTFRGWGELRLQISAAIIFSNSAFLAICLMNMT
jgi:hypothetical protein